MFSKINEILENPETASKIKDIASSLGGGAPSAPAPQESVVDDMAGFASSAQTVPSADSAAGDLGMDNISAMMSSISKGNDRHVALLNALTPYLRESRQAKVGVAIKAMQVIKMLGNLK